MEKKMLPKKNLHEVHGIASSIVARVSSIRWALAASAIFFAVGIGIGLSTPMTFSGLIEATFLSAKPHLDGKTQIYIAGYLFLHNIIATYLLVVIGTFFCMLPVASIALNGAVIASVLQGVGVPNFSGTLSVAMQLLPHAMFELPALIIAAAIGIYVGYAALAFLGVREILSRLRSGSAMFALVVVPLLAFAAFVESFAAIR